MRRPFGAGHFEQPTNSCAHQHSTANNLHGVLWRCKLLADRMGVGMWMLAR